MTADPLKTADGRYAEQLRRAAEMQAQWDAEDAEELNVIDLRDRAEVRA